MINLERNYEIIKEVCTRYRKEMTVFSAVVGNKYSNAIDLEEYTNFMNQLSLDMFIGNYLCALYNEETINLYLRLLEINDFIVWTKEISTNPKIVEKIMMYLCD